MKKISKRYKVAVDSADLTKDFEIASAISTLAKMPKTKFDETVEISANLGVDARQSDQMVRGTVNLPHGSGKKVIVAVFTNDPEAAKAAGADFAGMDDLIQKVLDGWTGFDVAISTTEGMKDVRKVARVLGPKGLMPNPKSGTVTDDIAKAIKEVKAGRVEFKMDKTANIHIIVGKRSFSEEQLAENIRAAVDVLVKARPETIRGVFIKRMVLSSSMSPSIKLASSVFNK